MTPKRKSFLKNSPVRIMFSLCMAVILFFASSVTLYAGRVEEQASFIFNGGSSFLYLDFFGNYQTDGSDRDSPIPYIYRGNFTAAGTFYVSNSWRARYANGYVSVKLNFKLASQITNMTFNRQPSVSIVNSSLPEDVSCSVVYISGSAEDFSCYLVLNFHEYEVMQMGTKFSVTFSFETAGYADANYFGNSYQNLMYVFSSSNDYAGDLRFYENLSDISAWASSVDKSFTAINNNLNMLNSNITSQTDILSAGLNNIDFNNINNYRIIENNQQSIINRLNANSTAEINNATANSKNEIDTANKNADDIMNSYDSTSQGSDNKRFDDSQKELQETEDSLFGSATGYFDAVDFTSAAASLTTIASSLSFVSNLMQQLYIKSGVFGMTVTISLVVMISSKIIGLYRFSTGGGGKGG